jgi:hypothetical protein
MNDTKALLELISKHWGFEVGNKIKQEISTVVGATNIDLTALQSAIGTIQGILDANPNTAQFDVGQNIITQLSDHLARIVNLESAVGTLNGNASTVGSVAYAVGQEQTRAVNAETALQTALDAETVARTNADTALQAELDATQAGAGLQADGTYLANSGANYIATATSLQDADNKLDTAIKAVDDARIADKSASNTAVSGLQAGIDANTASIATLNGANTVVGSVAHTAEVASAGAVATAKAYADATFVTKSDIVAIDAVALASMFRSAMDCGFGGATITDVLNGTGACAGGTTPPPPPAGGTIPTSPAGTGAVI